MVEVPLDVAKREPSDRAGVRSKAERVIAELDHGCAGAVADAEVWVVVAAEDAIAGAELALSEPHRVLAKVSGSEH